ncbi:MAG: CHAD domain-containing protein [Acidobacteria bacterium]|nr:CHAD domain-containing protein [Acidobacteriota bacterium]
MAKPRSAGPRRRTGVAPEVASDTAPPSPAAAPQVAAPMRKPYTQIPVTRFAHRQMEDRLQRVVDQVAETLRSPDEEAVHQVRVATRRFRAALDVFRAYFPRNERARIKQEIRELFALAGEVRNRDIASGLLAEGAPETAAYLQQERMQWSMRLTEHLRGWVLRDFSAQWRAALGSAPPDKKLKGRLPPGALLPEAAVRWLPRLARRFFRTGREAFATGDAEHLHEFRIAAKRFRYGLEFFAPLYGPRFTESLRRLKKLQDSLGRLNDLVTARALVPVPEITTLLAAREAPVRVALTSCWTEDFSAGADSALWVHYLRHYAGRTKAAQSSRPPKQPRIAIPDLIAPPKVAKRRA